MSDYSYNDNAICPYCDHEESDSWEIEQNTSEEWFQVECGSCEKTYLFERNISVTYNTERADCANGMTEHKWENRVSAPREYSIGKQQCKVCFSDREISKEEWEKIESTMSKPNTSMSMDEQWVPAEHYALNVIWKRVNRHGKYHDKPMKYTEFVEAIEQYARNKQVEALKDVLDNHHYRSDCYTHCIPERIKELEDALIS